MEYLGNYYYLDGNIFCSSDEDEPVTGEVSFYEVIRTKDGVPLFFPDHMQRLRDGIATRYELIDDISGMIRDGIEALAAREKFPEINVRVIVSFTGRDHSVHICYIPSSYPTEEMGLNGVRLILFRAERFDPGVKLLNDRLRLSVNEKIAKEKAYEALLVNSEGYITEGSRSNIFFIDSSGRIYTAPDRMVLQGITRKYVIELCRSEGYDLVFQAVKASEISEFQSAFITGTSPMVLPVSAIDNHALKAMSTITHRLMLLYREMAEDSITNFRMSRKGD